MTRQRRSRPAFFPRNRAGAKSARQNVSHPAHHRRLRFEPLEDRRLLAVFTVDNLDDAGLGSLRQAIADANAAVGADTVEFQAGLSGTIALSTGEMTITDDLTIDGPGAADLTIDAQHGSRIFHIAASSGPVTLAGLRLTGGDAVGDGGAILSETLSSLSIDSSTISGNSATGEFSFGGGIMAFGDLTVTGSTISGNSATRTAFGAFGGGIFAYHGDVAITGSTVSGNSATASGGGIFAFFGDVAITGSTVSENSAPDGGGFSTFFLGDVTVTNSTISGNSATNRGGGISTNGHVTVTGSTISDNSATGPGSYGSYGSGYGGGIMTFGDVTVTNSTISGNSATGNVRAIGGGIYAFDGDVTVTASTISGNSVTTGASLGYGGAIATRGNVTISASTISGNSVTGDSFGSTIAGGGIAAEGDVTVTTSTISDNSLTGTMQFFVLGGGIATRGGDVTVTASTISGNTVLGGFATSGGGIYARSADVTVTDSTISGNSATGGLRGAGGGIWGPRAVTVTNSTISGNSASGGLVGGVSGGGGGIFVTRGFAPHDPVTIENSIVAGNHTLDGTAPDLSPGFGTLLVRYSLIGDNTDTGLAEAPVGMPDANGNLIGDPGGAGIIDPMLGPLQDNGGPTFTHALLDGSPAINAGDPLFAPPPDFDQRGDPFVRVFDGRIDMGAFELQPATLDEKIQHLMDEGVLNRGQANSLLVKLNSAGNERAQLNRLGALINEINALVRAGILSAAEGQMLIDGAESLRNSLSVDAVLPLLVSRG